MADDDDTQGDQADTPSVSLQTVSQKLHKSKDAAARTALNISPEKRKVIEDHLRKGVGVVRCAQLTSSSPATCAVVRDHLLETEPDLFKRHMASTLHRLANKTADTIARGLENLEHEEIKPGQLPGLSVALGILLDKSAALAGDGPVQVVEHRLQVDADAINQALLRLSGAAARDVIDVTPSQSSASGIIDAQSPLC